MSSSFGTARSSTRRPTGTIIAPPMPCRKRAATNAARVPDTAHNSDPATNTTMALANTVRERALAEVGRDGRERGRDPRRVHVLHEEGTCDDEGNEDGALHRTYCEAIAGPRTTGLQGHRGLATRVESSPEAVTESTATWTPSTTTF